MPITDRVSGSWCKCVNALVSSAGTCGKDTLLSLLKRRNWSHPKTYDRTNYLGGRTCSEAKERLKEIKIAVRGAQRKTQKISD
jgi:hypothetical protein